jgi:hypothetical protein
MLEKRKRAEHTGAPIKMLTRKLVANSVVNFFLRLPEIFIFLSASVKIILLYNCPQSWESFILDIFYFSYILTFSTNVAMYYLFNTKFKQAFAFWSNVKKN